MAEAAATGLPQPRIIEVPICGGTKRLVVRPWSMEQQDEIFPLVSALIDEYVAWQGKPDAVSMGEIILRFQKEVAIICERTVAPQLAEQDLVWGKLWGEDLFGIAQAIWDTSIVRPGGGGMLGKAMTTLGPALARGLQSVVATQRSEQPTATTDPDPATPTSPSPS